MEDASYQENDGRSVLLHISSPPQTLGQELVDRLTGNRRAIGYTSVHNGLLLAADLLKAFDLYLWSIYLGPKS